MLKGEWQQELVELAEAQGSAVLWRGKNSLAKPSGNTHGLHGRQWDLENVNEIKSKCSATFLKRRGCSRLSIYLQDFARLRL